MNAFDVEQSINKLWPKVGKVLTPGGGSACRYVSRQQLFVSKVELASVLGLNQ